MIADQQVVSELALFDDPEVVFQEGWMLCDVGEHASGLPYLERAVYGGYLVAPTLARSPQFDGLRDHAAFQALLADAEARRKHAMAAFRKFGGKKLLG
jgi:hypothetical protein